jgi:anti-sigma regulatory factor (Ser/Thr protein kinase)
MHLQFPGGPTAPRVARSVVEARLRGRVPPELMDDVRLVVSELVTNSVLHGGAGPGDHVRLRVTLDRSTVRLEVSDGGPGPPVGTPELRDGQTAGWGLFLVDRVAGRWGVKAGKPPSVWAELAA